MIGLFLSKKRAERYHDLLRKREAGDVSYATQSAIADCCMEATANYFLGAAVFMAVAPFAMFAVLAVSA